MTRAWRKLYNEGRHDVYFSPNQMRENHLDADFNSIQEKRNAYKFLQKFWMEVSTS
jgi:hypothetical protein